MEIIINNRNPNLYDFNVSKNTFKETRDFLRNNYVNAGYWYPLLDEFKKQEGYWNTQPEIFWIQNTKLDRPKGYLEQRLAST